MTFPASTEASQVRALMERKTDVTLTKQQELFVLEYMIDLNATQAAIRAGYPPLTATNTATKMMKRGPVRDAIARAMAARSRRTGVTADRVIREAAKVAFGDPRVLFREDGALRAPTEYDEDDAAMIEGIKTRRIVEVGSNGEMVPVEIQEVKLASKMGALTLLAKHLGILTDKLDVNVNGLDVRLNEAFKRMGMTITTGEVIDVEHEEVEPDVELTPEQAEIEARLAHLHQMIEAPAEPYEPRQPTTEEYDMEFMLGLKASPG